MRFRFDAPSFLTSVTPSPDFGGVITGGEAADDCTHHRVGHAPVSIKQGIAMTSAGLERRIICSRSIRLSGS